MNAKERKKANRILALLNHDYCYCSYNPAYTKSTDRCEACVEAGCVTTNSPDFVCKVTGEYMEWYTYYHNRGVI